MKIQESGQMYLETILILSQRNGNVRAIDIAHEMDFSKPSVSRGLSILKEEGCIEVADNGNITLTAKGREIAEDIYDKHNVLSEFFISIGVSEQTAVDDACKIEHIISDETFAAVKKIVRELPENND